VRAVQAHRFRRNERRFDVFHAINYVPPGKIGRPVLPFIHDLSHIRHPNMHPRDRVEWLQEQLALVADAPLVQTNSQFSKGEITAVLGIPAERIHVTYAAPGADFRRAPDGDEAWLAKNGLTARRFILAVGTREPRKNFTSVAEAYVGLPENLRAQIPLVWCGPAGWGDLSLSPSAARAKAPDKYESLATFPIVNWRRSIVTARYLSWRRFTKASACRWLRRWPAARVSR
jgi:hypothetical protein